MQRGNWDYANPNVPWTQALNALDYYRPSYYYFYLKHPPEDETGPGYNVKHDAGKGGFSQYGFRSYEQVQADIKAWMKHIYDIYNTNSVEKVIKTMRSHLITQKEECYEEERAFFENIMKESGHGGQFNYEILLSNTTPSGIKNIEQKKSKNVSEIPKMTTVEFWTRAGNSLLGGINALKEKIEQDKSYADKLAAATAFKSRDLYDILVRDFNASIFSRHSALKYAQEANKQAREKGQKELFPDIDDKYIRDLGNLVDNVAMQVLETDIEQLIMQELDQEMQEDLKTIFSTALPDIRSYKKRGTLKQSGAPVTATTASVRIRNDVMKALKDNKTKIKQKTLDKYFKDKVFNLGSGSDIYFSIPLDKGGNALYEASVKFQLKETGSTEGFKNIIENDKNMQERLIQVIFDTLIKNIKELPATQLDLSSLGYFDIEQYYRDINSFKNGAARALQNYENNAYHIIKRSVQRPDFYKNFTTANSPQYVSGLLGELGTMLDFQQLVREANVVWTGSSYTEFGQSANDLQWKDIGMQVKRSVYRSSGEYTLYDRGNDLSIKDEYLRRYLGWEDLQLMRFVAGNAKFFEHPDRQLQEIATTVAHFHIESFYRINVYNARAGARDKRNVFFEISNVIYPGTYIYDCALEQLNKIAEEEDMTGKSALFNVQVSSSNNYDSRNYEDINEARENYYIDNYRVSNNYKDLQTDITFRTKGLKVNLMKLALFSE